MGYGAPASIEGDTIVEAFRHSVRRLPDRAALRWWADGAWSALTWAGYGRAVDEVAAGLAEVGVLPGDRIAILSGNRTEWHLADVGVLVGGAVTVPIYQTSSPEQVAYVLGHSEARLCFVENELQLAKVLEVRDQLSFLCQVVVFGGGRQWDDAFVKSFADLRSSGVRRLDREPALVESRSDAVVADQLATLVYTSGTTGPPKGAMISHANIMWTLRSAISVFDLREGERFLSFLPLSHIAERMISDFASAATGGETWFARSIGTVGQDLRACRPTDFFAVPRVWEKLREAILNRLDGSRTLQRMVVDYYVQLSQHVGQQKEAGRHPALWTELPQRALDATIGAQVRHELGLDKAHILVASAAPVHPDLLRWLAAIGLPVLEVYGQTETCGPTTANPPEGNRIGTVGLPLPGVRLLIAEDSEILVRGGNVCKGYFRDPEGSAQLIDGEGWLHSGDMGALDAGGYLRITGRKKDLIITAAGQNVAPQDIESDLRNSELLSEAVVIGDGRRYLTALLTLDIEALLRWARERGKEVEPRVLLADPDLKEAIDRIVKDVNDKRSRVEHVRAFRVLDHDFAVASGEMTQTLKVKRNVVIERHRKEVDEMYGGESQP
jgi:long-chain acyl-CoA synthetase